MTGNDKIQIKILFTHSNIALKNMGENKIPHHGISKNANVIHVLYVVVVIFYPVSAEVVAILSEIIGVF